MTDARALENDVRVALYRLWIERGAAPVPADIARALDARPADVEDALRRLHDEHALVLAPGTPYVWMAHPLSALPTPYRAVVGERRLWANCVWDAFGIVAMLGGTGRVEAKCGDCGDDLDIDVRDGAVAPADHVVHYAVPAAHWWDDIGFN